MPSSTSPAAPSPLPYHDTKAVGAPDFYAAINATFRFIERRFGMEGLRRYWVDLGRAYYAPVSLRWKQQGLVGVAEYWRAFFAAEPAAEVTVHATENEVAVEVRKCPAIHYLRQHQREIVPHFCQHCYFVSQAAGETAGVEVRVTGGNGACMQRFAKRGSFVGSQDLSCITLAS